MGVGIPKYISKDFKTVKNPSYVKETEAAWQKWQNQGKSWSTGNYKDLGIHQKINLKGTLNYSKGKKWSSDISAGGKRVRKPKAKEYFNDHPSMLYRNDPSAQIASEQKWDFSKDFHH